jgi:hypothetical protein
MCNCTTIVPKYIQNINTLALCVAMYVFSGRTLLRSAVIIFLCSYHKIITSTASRLIMLTFIEGTRASAAQARVSMTSLQFRVKKCYIYVRKHDDAPERLSRLRCPLTRYRGQLSSCTRSCGSSPRASAASRSPSRSHNDPICITPLPFPSETCWGRDERDRARTPLNLPHCPMTDPGVRSEIGLKLYRSRRFGRFDEARAGLVQLSRPF